MSVIWQEPMVAGQGPPQTKKRKDTLPEHRHTHAEWERMRDIIMELFEDYDLNDVADRLRDDHGFEASAPQIRNRLKNWGHWKYLKLSEKQLRYISNTLHERSEEGREKTAFRLGPKKIPSATLERRLNERPDLNIDEVGSIVSGMSSCNLSAYTSSTANGVRTNFNRRPQSTVSLASVPEDASVHTSTSTTEQSRHMLYERLCEAEESLRITTEVLADSQDELRREKESSWNIIEELKRKYNHLETGYLAMEADFKRSDNRYKMLLDELESVHDFYRNAIDDKDDQLQRLQAQIDHHLCVQSLNNQDEEISGKKEEQPTPIYAPNPPKPSDEPNELQFDFQVNPTSTTTPRGTIRSQHIASNGVVSVSCAREAYDTKAMLQLFKLTFEGFCTEGDVDYTSIGIVEREFYALTDPEIFDSDLIITYPDRFRIVRDHTDTDETVWDVQCVECKTTNRIILPTDRAYSVDNDGTVMGHSSCFSLWFSSYTRQHIRSPDHRANALYNMLGLKWDMVKHKPTLNNTNFNDRPAENEGTFCETVDQGKVDKETSNQRFSPQQHPSTASRQPSVESSIDSDSESGTDLDSDDDYELHPDTESDTTSDSNSVTPTKLITAPLPAEQGTNCTEQPQLPTPDEEQVQDITSPDDQPATVSEGVYCFHDPMQYQVPPSPILTNKTTPTTENDNEDIEMISIDDVLDNSLWCEEGRFYSDYLMKTAETNEENSTSTSPSLKFTLPVLNLFGA